MKLAPPSSHEITATLIAHWRTLAQPQIDKLLGPLRVPIGALMRDADGGGLPAAMIRVERHGRRFEFSADPEVRPVCAFVARDHLGEAQDIIGWSARDEWIGTWLGRAVLLGEHELLRPRFGAPLPVFTSVLPWLQGGRAGCVILNGKRARHDLEGVTMMAANVEEGLAIRRLLSAPDPKIVVPSQAIQQVAA
jgi:hypothetical protein